MHVESAGMCVCGGVGRGTWQRQATASVELVGLRWDENGWNKTKAIVG